MTKITNEWITLQTLHKGITVQRKFAGLYTKINAETNDVERCDVYYFQRELYPNGDVIKKEEKFYTLQDLAYTELEIENVMYSMEPLAVLSGFVQQLGMPGIVNPARDTLENQVILPADSANGYPLRRDTREKTIIE